MSNDNLRARWLGATAIALILSMTAPAPASAQLFFDWGGSEQKVNDTGRMSVRINTDAKVGEIIVSFTDRKLFLITGPGQAISYPVAIPREQDRWEGQTSVTQKRENPSWTPTPTMIKENPRLPRWVPGGHPMNPLGNRALYLGSSYYRIHGTDAPWTIGTAVSKGCIRMYNKDALEVYERTKVGAKVLVTWKTYQFSPDGQDQQAQNASYPQNASQNNSSHDAAEPVPRRRRAAASEDVDLSSPPRAAAEAPVERSRSRSEASTQKSRNSASASGQSASHSGQGASQSASSGNQSAGATKRASRTAAAAQSAAVSPVSAALGDGSPSPIETGSTPVSKVVAPVEAETRPVEARPVEARPAEPRAAEARPSPAVAKTQTHASAPSADDQASRALMAAERAAAAAERAAAAAERAERAVSRSAPASASAPQSSSNQSSSNQSSSNQSSSNQSTSNE